MDNYFIVESSKEEEDLVWNGIIKYNSTIIPLKQEVPFKPINRVLKDKKGNVIGGINSMLYYCWNTTYVDMLWVNENYRKKGHGSKLLNAIEKIAQESGCTLIHLETMDFQAKDFYIKSGYAVFGELDNVPFGHKRYYMRKIF